MSTKEDFRYLKERVRELELRDRFPDKESLGRGIKSAVELSARYSADEFPDSERVPANKRLIELIAYGHRRGWRSLI